MEEFLNYLKDPNKTVVTYTAPAVRASIGEIFDIHNENLSGKLNTLLKDIGVDYVLDMTYGADLTIVEEATEFLKRLQANENLPIFTSCCPMWVKFAQNNPEALKHLSTTKSPQEIFSSLLKEYLPEKLGKKAEDIIIVSIVPCVMKKIEAKQLPTTDCVIEVKELNKYITENNIDFVDLGETPYDEMLGQESGSGVIFGRTGGVMESALRTVYDLATGKEKLRFTTPEYLIKETPEYSVYEFQIDEVTENIDPMVSYFIKDWNFLKGKKIKFSVINGVAKIKKFLRDLQTDPDLKDVAIVEFMNCEGGCVGGFGQPIGTPELRKQRIAVLDNSDSKDMVKISSQNPHIRKIYTDFLKSGFGETDRVYKIFHHKWG